MIKKKLVEQKARRVQLKSSLPNVNKDLFMKLKDQEKKDKKPLKKGDLLGDDRFGALFTNPEFEVDQNEEAYRLLNPVVARLDKSRKKELEKELSGVQELGNDAVDIAVSGESDLEESSDDDQEWTKEVKKEHKIIQKITSYILLKF